MDFTAPGLVADRFYLLTEGFRFSCVSASLCLFLSGIDLLQQRMIHSLNIYSSLTHLPGEFSSPDANLALLDSHGKF